MAQINRYTQTPVAQYNPMSMEELAFAPTFLRQRHDATAQGLAELQQASGQYDVLDPYKVTANQIVDPLQKGISTISEQLASQGINRSNAIPEAMKLKAQYNEAFGPNGAIGQLQNATKSYRAQAEEINKFFEKNPELARGALRELKPGQATLKDGKLQLGQMQTPNYTRHYDAKEINDILNSQIDNIKDTTLTEFGFQNIGGISSIQDVYKQGQIEGRKVEDITNILMAQLSPEVIRSAQQYGKYVYGDANKGVQALQLQIAGAAQGRANQIDKSSYSVITNEDRKFDKENVINNWTFDNLPGTKIAEDPTTKSFYENVQNIDKVTTQPKDYVIKSKNNNEYIYVDDSGNPLSINQAAELIAKGRSNIKQIPFVNFEAIKKSSPRFENMPTKEFMSLYTNYMNTAKSSFDKAIIPVGEDMKWLQDRVIGSKGKEGLLSLKQIKTPDGTQAAVDMFLKQAGYSSLDDFYENAGPSMKGYSPANGAYAFTYKDKNNKSQTAYVEADQALKQATINTLQLSTLAKTGAPFVALGEKANLGIPGTEDYVKYFVNDYRGGVDGVKLVIAPANKTEKEIIDNINDYTTLTLGEIRMAEQAQFQSSKSVNEYFK